MPGTATLNFGNQPGYLGIQASPAPLTLQSNSPLGTFITALAPNVPDSPTTTLVNAANGVLALNASPLEIVAGPTPADYTSSGPSHVYTLVITCTSADGRSSVTMPMDVAITPISTPLGPTGPTSATTAYGLPQGYQIAALTGPFNDGSHTNAHVAITADNIGTPYTGGQVQLDWTGTILLYGPTAFSSGSVTAWYQKDFGGAITYTQFTISGASASAPSGLTWTPAGSQVYEGYSGPQYSAGVVSGTAHGANNVLLWDFTSNPNGYWAVDRASGKVYPRSPLTAGSYPVTLRATDALGQTATISETLVVQAFTPAALNDTVGGTSVLAWFDMNLGTLSPTTGTLNSLTGPDGSVWNLVGATGPTIVPSSMNGKTVARFSGTQAMACAATAIQQLGPTTGGVWAKPFTVLMVAKNTYAGANAAYIASLLSGSSTLLWWAQQTASAASMSLSGTASWTALPNGTAENLGLYNTGGNSLSTPPGNQLESLQNATTGATNKGNPPAASGVAVNNVVLGGQSAAAAPTIGFVGDVPLFVVLEGIPNPMQLRAWSNYVATQFGLGTQTVPLVLNWGNSTTVKKWDFDDPQVSDYWYDPNFAMHLADWIPTEATYNTPNPAGGIITSNPYASWWLDDRNPLYYHIDHEYAQAGSSLIIDAKPTPAQMFQYIGTSYYQGYNPNFLPGTSYPYLSGTMCTQPQFKMQWGVVSFRFKLTPSSGLWPACWMYDACHGTTEFDFFEIFGAQVDGAPLTSLHTTIHCVSLSGGSEVIIPNYFPDYSDTTGDYIELTLDWNPSTMTFYYNGLEYWQVATPADANNPMFMLMNNAVASGASFTFPPNPGIFPAKLSVDYVEARTQNGVLPTPTPPSGTNAKTTAFLSALSTAGGSLTGGEQTGLNTLYNTLDGIFWDRQRPSASLYSKLDQAYCGAFANNIARTISLTTPGTFTLTANGTVTYGSAWIQGDGSASYFETGYDPVVVAAGMTARDVHMSAYIVQAPSTDALGYLFGNNIDALRVEPVTENLAPIQAATQFTWPTGAAGTLGLAPFNAGKYTVTRVNTGLTGGADPMSGYYNGGFFAMATSSPTATTFTSGKTFRICGADTNTPTFSDAKIGFVSWGASMTPDEVPAMDTAIYALLHACNPSVYP